MCPLNLAPAGPPWAWAWAWPGAACVLFSAWGPGQIFEFEREPVKSASWAGLIGRLWGILEKIALRFTEWPGDGCNTPSPGACSRRSGFSGRISVVSVPFQVSWAHGRLSVSSWGSLGVKGGELASGPA